MFQLFGRFAWVLSFVLGYIISLCIFSLGSGFRGIGGEESFLLILVGGLIGCIVKSVFFSKSFIEQRVRFFAEAISGNTSKTSPKKIKQSINEPVKTSVVSEKAHSTTTKSHKANYVEPPLISAIKGFFRENLLAKIGGILLFLGVLFFLNLIYTAVGPIAKVVIGIVFGISVYGAGLFLDKKGFTNESRVLLGLGILINYLVILSGRYLIGDVFSDSGILSVGVTLLFLIANTIFAIITSIIYQSRVLLIFSFVFAFLNPLLVGGDAQTPYVLLGYASIVALAGMYLVWDKRFAIDSVLLTYISFFGANILFILAPFEETTGWVAKILCFSLLSVGMFYSTYKKKETSQLLFLIASGYVLFLGHILIGGVSDSLGVYLFSLVPLALMFGAVNFCALHDGKVSHLLLGLLLLPLLILFFMLFLFPIGLSIYSIAIFSFLYLGIFIQLGEKLPNIFRYAIGVGLGGFLILSNVSLYSIDSILISELSFVEYSMLIGVLLTFLAVSYIFSLRKGLHNLYLTGTLGFTFSILPLIVITGNYNFIILSVIALCLFWCANTLTPFFSDEHIKDKESFYSFLIGLIVGLLCIVFHLHMYISEYYSDLVVGGSFLIGAVAYLVLGYYRMKRFNISLSSQGKRYLFMKNMILAYWVSCVSLISLGIGFLFSQYPEIISMIWLFEATVLFYFFYRIKDYKIYVAGVILMIIGLLQLMGILFDIEVKDYLFFIPGAIILASLFTNTKYLISYTEKTVRYPHDILHILGIGILLSIVTQIIPYSTLGISYFAMAIFISILAILYYYYSSVIQKWFLIVMIGGFGVSHIGNIETIIPTIREGSKEYLIVVQYIVSIIISASGYVFAKLKCDDVQRIVLFSITSVYIFIISTLYIYDLFSSTFSVTIYWGILAFIALVYGISQNVIKYRTLGLYVLFLTLGKILLYDIWVGFDDAVLRIGALMVVGVMMIIISMMYSKKYGNNLKGEFGIENLK